MQALVGQAAPFDQGREQLRLLAGLEVTAKAVERQAEAIGEDLQAREHLEIQRAMRLDLPAVEGEPIPIFYVQIDGTGIPVVKKETAGRQGKIDGQPAHTREAKLGCVFTQTGWDEQGFALRDTASTTYTGAIETADEFGQRLYLEAWNRGWGRAHKKVVVAMAPPGSGISPRNIFPARLKLSICSTPASTCGNWRANFILTTRAPSNAGSFGTRRVGSTRAKSNR